MFMLLYNIFCMETRVPLAERMRPRVLSEFVGQKHIIGKNMLLRRAIEMGEVGSCIFMVRQALEKPHWQI